MMAAYFLTPVYISSEKKAANKLAKIRIDVMWYFSLGWYFRIIGHPIKGLPDNVETSKNARGLSIVYVFILTQKMTADKVVGE